MSQTIYYKSRGTQGSESVHLAKFAGPLGEPYYQIEDGRDNIVWLSHENLMEVVIAFIKHVATVAANERG